MYKLSQFIQDLISSDVSIRLQVAGSMGVDTPAIMKYIKENGGVKIASHYDAVNMLIDKTGKTVGDIRIAVTEPQTAMAHA